MQHKINSLLASLSKHSLLIQFVRLAKELSKLQSERRMFKNTFMKNMLAILILIFVCYGCKKNVTDSSSTCFKGKYLGEGCWTVIPVAQLLKYLVLQL